MVVDVKVATYVKREVDCRFENFAVRNYDQDDGSVHGAQTGYYHKG